MRTTLPWQISKGDGLISHRLIPLYAAHTLTGARLYAAFRGGDDFRASRDSVESPDCLSSHRWLAWNFSPLSERFFVDAPISAARIELSGPEAQHLTKVLRAKCGDEVTLFDGSGAEFRAVVADVGRQRVALEVRERREIDRELARNVTLAVALPKGDRQQWLVEKATELGVRRIVPLITHRGVAQPVAAALARMQRWVIEASKQCGRNRLLEIAAPAAWSPFASQTTAGTRWFAHLGDGAPIERTTLDSVVTIAIGPEGGWTEEEVAVARMHGWTQVSLGARILRVETAAVALTAWVAVAADKK
jgi:16S rRNA (uracil1498-N3)-methyltransferase